MDNRLFVSDSSEDLDRIDVISDSPSSTRSEQNFHFTNSRNVLTVSGPGYRQRHFNGNDVGNGHGNSSRVSKVEQCGDESIELIDGLEQLDSRSPLSIAGNCNRVSTPTNMVRRWSQTLSRYNKDKHSIREETISHLPSRRVFEVDGKLLVGNNADREAEIELLAKEMEQHEGLMEDSPLGQQNRLETLRALPQPLHMKRVLKQKLSICIEKNTSEEKRRNLCHRLINGFIYVSLKLWSLLGMLVHYLEIWYDALKTIEGHFGSNMSSYFKFLRRLFMLNMVMFVCTFAFIILPQILYNLFSDNNMENVNNNVTYVDKSNTSIFMDLLTGQGSLESSLLFYGSYTNATIRLNGSSSSYNLPQAYYMTMLLLYLFTFVLISTSMARSYRISFIQTAGATRSMYTQKIFCSWDFGISDRKAAELKHFAIFTELKEVLSEISEPKKSLSMWWRIWVLCSLSVAHMLVCALIAGMGIVIWTVLKDLDGDKSSSWNTLSVAGVVNLSMLIMQSTLSWISKMEDYRSPRRTLHIALLRNFMWESVVIGILLYFLLTRKYNECWETYIGQEIYRFIVMDLLVSMILVPVLAGARVFLSTHVWSKLGRPEFDISQKSLGLVFNQTLLWLGLLFAPFLAAIMVVKMVLTFYAHKAMLLYLCKSPRHVWRSAQTQTLYLIFTFLSLLCVMVTYGYVMTQVPVSAQCGPFRDYGYMFQIFIDGILKLRQYHTLWLVLTTLVRPAAVGLLLIIMAIMVYYLRAKSRARCLMVKMLKEMVYLEVRDKEYLLAKVTNNVRHRQWLLEQRKTTEDGTLNESKIEDQQNTTLGGDSLRSHGSSGNECILRSRNV